MEQQPLRSLLLGYGFSALLAGSVHVAGGSLLVAILIAWLGGAAGVLAVAAVSGEAGSGRKQARHAGAEAESDAAWLARENELRQWDRDLADDLRAAAATGPPHRARTGSTDG